MVNILGIETSCDETAVAIVQDSKNINERIVAEITTSQIAIHQPYGGVVPEVAARAHLQNINTIIETILAKANMNLNNIDAIACTGGPGLLLGLIIGTSLAKAIACTSNIPLIFINHLEGHALTTRLTHNTPYPYLLLLISGGHCQTIIVKNIGDYQILGETIDDSAGEAFDKVARMIGLPYPGGPEIQNLAQHGQYNTFTFPKPLYDKNTYNFSFAGLKSSVSRTINKIQQDQQTISEQNKANIAASFENTIVDAIINKTEKAIKYFIDNIPNGKNFVVSGGVAANQKLRNKLKTLTQQYNLNFYAPPVNLCTDNAAMIAWAGYERFCQGNTSELNFKPKPNWPITNTHQAYTNNNIFKQ